MTRKIINTPLAPAPLGPYSQAVRFGNLVFISGQIGLAPNETELAPSVIAQAERAFLNLAAVAKQAGGSLNDALRITIYLTDLGEFPKVNEIMARHFAAPYPARATVGVSQLPKGALVEIDAVLGLTSTTSTEIFPESRGG